MCWRVNWSSALCTSSQEVCFLCSKRMNSFSSLPRKWMKGCFDAVKTDSASIRERKEGRSIPWGSYMWSRNSVQPFSVMKGVRRDEKIRWKCGRLVRCRGDDCWPRAVEHSHTSICRNLSRISWNMLTWCASKGLQRQIYSMLLWNPLSL